MNTLFPTGPVLPPGFAYYPDFISEAEEVALCREIAAVELHTFTFQGYEAKRKVASFGHDWNFEKQQLLKGKAFPASFHFLVAKVSEQLSMHQEAFAELLITEYPAGSVINWHRDAPPFDLIAGISLRSDCTFRLRPFDKSKQGRAAIISIPVQRRSLYIMAGASRTDWQHSISPVKALRYSITLRTLSGSTSA